MCDMRCSGSETFLSFFFYFGYGVTVEEISKEQNFKTACPYSREVSSQRWPRSCPTREPSRVLLTAKVAAEAS